MITGASSGWPPLARVAASAAVGLCLIYTVSSMLVRPSLLPDPSWGLMVPKSVRAGAPWNHVREASEENIAVDRTSFHAKMSPGQHLLPDLLMSAGWSTGSSIALVSRGASLVGLLAWWWFFAVLGYSRSEATVSCLLLAASRNYNQPFLSYPGGEVLGFLAFPLIVSGAYLLRSSWWLTPYAVFAIVAAFLAKNSLPIYVGVWIGAQSLLTIYSRGMTSSVWKASGPVIATAGSMLGIHFAYSSRGWTALDYEPAVSTAASDYLTPWAMPVLAATSWDDVFSWLFGHPSGAPIPFAYKQSALFMGVIAVASVGFALMAVRRHATFAVWVTFVYSVVAVTALTVLWVSGAAASLDLSRHYRLIGYVWLPLMVSWLLASRPPLAWLLTLTLVVPALYALLSYGANWRRHYEHRDSHSPRVQVTHLQLTPRLVRSLTTLDETLPGGNTLVVTPAPTYALEFDRIRVLATNTVADPLDRRPPHRGTVDNLVLIADLPGMSEAKRAQWLASFPSYRDWEWFDLDDHRFYLPKGQVVNPAWLKTHLK